MCDAACIIVTSISRRQVRWKHAFEQKKTLTASFFLHPKETSKVLMMNQQHYYNCGFCEKLDCDVIELPFSNDYTKVRTC